LEINAILYEDNLIKRVGYIDGWNGIQEQLFNRLKQFIDTSIYQTRKNFFQVKLYFISKKSFSIAIDNCPIKRVGYIDGWNGIQEQLFNRLKQFL